MGKMNESIQLNLSESISDKVTEVFDDFWYKVYGLHE